MLVLQKCLTSSIVPTPQQILQTYGKVLRSHCFQQPLKIDPNNGSIKYNDPKQNKAIKYIIPVQAFLLLTCIISAAYCIVLKITQPHHPIYQGIIPLVLALYVILLSFAFLSIAIGTKLLEMVKPFAEAYNALLGVRNGLQFYRKL